MNLFTKIRGQNSIIWTKNLVSITMASQLGTDVQQIDVMILIILSSRIVFQYFSQVSIVSDKSTDHTLFPT